MSDAAPSKSSLWFTFVAAIGGFAIFVVILLVAYLPRQAAPLIEGAKTPEQRKAALAELRAHEAKAAAGYAWIDQSKGVVQLPLDRAVELTLNDLAARK
ncbi:MAG: hypothetical protein JF599_00690 [Verrucomicrobia bacterium]|nr:hypothetical protein [Verrucomicrobiota bacterium]